MCYTDLCHEKKIFIHSFIRKDMFGGMETLKVSGHILMRCVNFTKNSLFFRLKIVEFTLNLRKSNKVV